MFRASTRHLLLATLPATVLAAAGLAACRPSEPPPPEPGPRIESPALGLALAEVPVPFEVVESGAEIVLAAGGEQGEGRLTLSAGPEQRSGINLVEEVKARRAAFEAAPEGTYHGNRELGTPNGPAYTARGSYLAEDGRRVEETWVYTLHPDANRLVTLTYRYPPEESEERVNQLLFVLGEIEGLAGG